MKSMVVKNVRGAAFALLFFVAWLHFPFAAEAAEGRESSGDPVSDQSVAGGTPSTSPAPGLEKIKAAKEQAEEAKLEAESAQKEVKIQTKAVELEKKKAEVEFKEVELAIKAAEVIRSIDAGEDEIRKADAKVQKEQKEASVAYEKVRIAEGKILAAQERVRITEEELSLVQEKVALAEAKIRNRQSLFYKKLIRTGLVFLIGYLLIFILGRIINSKLHDLRTQHLVRRYVIYFINLLIVLFVIFIWIQHISSLTIFLSAVGAGVALALQEVILSIAGWFAILLRRPFELGDRIEFGGVKGDVIDISMLQTTLLEIGNWVDADQSTGRIVNVPNSAIFKKENYNYSRGFEFIWNEMKVLITFESDWKRAEEIMLGHALGRAEGMEDIVKKKIKRMSRRYMIHYGKLTPIVYVNIKDSGVEMTLRYLTEARKRRSTQDEFARAILEDFEKEERVNFAYPTYRIVR